MKEVAQLLSDILSPFRIVRANFLVTIALRTGRPKDFARILALLEIGVVASTYVEKLATRFELQSERARFRKKFLDE